MTWMLTASGTRFDLRFIAADAVRIDDIAHHLAQINRYTGACSRPYSVAEHSLLVVEILQRDLGVRNPSLLMLGLMHDAHEAYTNDLSRPMKDVVGDWRQEEARIELAVRKAFGLAPCTDDAAATVKWADNVALVTERAQLLPPSGGEWWQAAKYPRADWWRADDAAGFAWLDWRQAFRDKFDELQHAIELQRDTTHTPE